MMNRVCLASMVALVGSFAQAETVTNTVAASSVVSCNPLSATSCAPDVALATSVSDDFKESTDNYVPYRSPSEIFYGDDGLTLTLSKRFDNPSLVSDFYIMFGKVEVLLKSANGTGVISSFYLQSDDLDEIDMEWFGGDASQMQSNFFSKGDTSTYDRGEYHNMADPREAFHNYTLDWNEDSLSWYIDGTLVRTLESTSSQGYPQTPMRLFFGIWAGGDESNSEGTIEWAGGLTDYADAPFSMHIKNLVVSDYSSGSEYVYTDQTGSWDSIKAVDGEVNGRKAIAIAEFASLVGGNDIVSVNSSLPTNSTTSMVSSSLTSILSSSTTHISGSSTTSTDSKHKTTSQSTSKSASLTSKHLGSSSISTSTTGKDKSASTVSLNSENGAAHATILGSAFTAAALILFAFF